ncbi:CLUMA_CG001335, isoform A [Clunio marinus]|uniref:CLUMA_CG001335, isoform A n=1 Tax=Clunio marinus TaxID=568069 RepID=A0A1J1HHN0_9DIPT|nr:CLUMA_CG001335, isoform A [Clunio marinus]
MLSESNIYLCKKFAVSCAYTSNFKTFSLLICLLNAIIVFISNGFHKNLRVKMQVHITMKKMK